MITAILSSETSRDRLCYTAIENRFPNAEKDPSIKGPFAIEGQRLGIESLEINCLQLLIREEVADSDTCRARMSPRSAISDGR